MATGLDTSVISMSPPKQQTGTSTPLARSFKNSTDLLLEDLESSAIPVLNLNLSPIPLNFDSPDSGLGSFNEGPILNQIVTSPSQIFPNTSAKVARPSGFPSLNLQFSQPPSFRKQRSYRLPPSPELELCLGKRNTTPSQLHELQKHLLFDDDDDDEGDTCSSRNSDNKNNTCSDFVSLKPKRIIFDDSDADCETCHTLTNKGALFNHEDISDNNNDINNDDSKTDNREDNSSVKLLTLSSSKETEAGRSTAEHPSCLQLKWNHIHEIFHEKENDSYHGCDLISDYSRPYMLPTVPGKHRDLKSISSNTLAQLLDGPCLKDVTFRIIDCRYPYEYNGGHIKGAENIHSQAKIEVLLNESDHSNDASTLLIFHCEFSSERAPKRARFLRSLDRQRNGDCYPQLNFPEVYILDGGYKEFYQQHHHLCTPEAYVPMLHDQYRDQLKKYRGQSWKTKTTSRLSLPQQS